MISKRPVLRTVTRVVPVASGNVKIVARNSVRTADRRHGPERRNGQKAVGGPKPVGDLRHVVQKGDGGFKDLSVSTVQRKPDRESGRNVVVRDIEILGAASPTSLAQPVYSCRSFGPANGQHGGRRLRHCGQGGIAVRSELQAGVPRTRRPSTAVRKRIGLVSGISILLAELPPV